MAQRHLVIVGCGIVGAMIAYELSRLPHLQITVLDQQPPARGSTGAALGVLMGIISHKVKGRNWRLRETSLQRYRTLIPELETQLGRSLPYNRDGILSLCFDPEDMPRWQSLQTIRQQQGYSLEIWSVAETAERCPDLKLDQVAAAIYSPQDGQIDPTALTLALVEAAQQKGVQFQFQSGVQRIEKTAPGYALHTADHTYPADLIVLAAGLGSTALTQTLAHPVSIGPVLGQALRLKLQHPLNQPDFQPTINGNDVHLVPLGHREYWVGATVEFPPDISEEEVLELKPEADRLQAVLAGAIAYCPALAQAETLQTWFGLRPRPQGQAAPVIGPVPDHPHVWLATGHYRNGVLLAPATALKICEAVQCA